MNEEQPTGKHSAEAAALGFYFQTFYALLTLLKTDTDSATVCVEQLDDVVLKANGQTLYFQLKHSISAAPATITTKSRSLWSAVKVWLDALPLLSLSETTFHLVTVAPISASSPLLALTSMKTEREPLLAALVEEATRVVNARSAAAASKKPLSA